MKKFMPLLIITLCGLLFGACSAQSEAEGMSGSLQESKAGTFATTQPEETEKAHDETTIESVPEETAIDPTAATTPLVVYEKYDIYEIGIANNESVFNIAIDGNPLDAAYLQELTTANTTAEMIAVEEKYISLWQEELDFAVAAYCAVLTQDDAQAFCEVQEMFTRYETAVYSYDSDLVLNHKYDIQVGSQAHQLLLSEKRETIRQRAIHIKYLHYLLECAAGATEFSSLTWS